MTTIVTEKPPLALTLIACGATKLDHAAPAKELYTGGLFKKQRLYVETAERPWYVLSAKHGLVHPDAVIEPYDLELGKLSSLDRVRWAQRVIVELMDLVKLHGRGCFTVELLAGEAYRNALLEMGRAPLEFAMPTYRLGSGQQLHWLNEMTRRERFARLHACTLHMAGQKTA